MLAVLGERWLPHGKWKAECAAVGINENTFKSNLQRLRKAQIVKQVGTAWGKRRDEKEG
jgi:hypothetical protein